MSAIRNPYKVLGISHNASEAEAHAAYRARAKATHPDTHGGGDREAFEEALNAYEEIKQNHSGKDQRKGSKGWDNSSRNEEAFEGNQHDTSDTDPILMIKNYLNKENLMVRFDSSLCRKDHELLPLRYEEIKSALGRPDLNYNSLHSRLVLHVYENKIKINSLVLKSALELVIEESQLSRKSEVMWPLYSPLSSLEEAEALKQWTKLAKVFNCVSALSVAILKKFIYQVKRKSIGQPVERHLMPIIQNRIHGGGKTSVVLKLLHPLEELQSGPTLFDDYMDRRSGSLYSYPVVVIDDIAKVKPDDMSVLNGIITGDALQRRKLGTSQTVRIRQASTLIGTCNKELSELLPDEAGNRRFAVLPLRNGAIEKGGDPEVWQIINSIDFRLLWRSVDALGSDPILPELESLERWQGYHRRRSTLESWLSELSLDATDVQMITEERGIKVSELFNLYLKQTKDFITLAKFGTELGRLISNKVGPFVRKEKLAAGIFCVIG